MASVSSDYNLAIIHAALAGQWHPTRNGSLTPRYVTTPSSSKRVWCICRKGREWPTTIVNRTVKGQGCPGCYQKLKKSHSFKIVDPNLVREWHPERNLRLGPKDVAYGSERKVWWLSPEGHE